MLNFNQEKLQHFLGLAGILYIIDFNVEFNNVITNIETFILLPLKPYGPHLLTKFLTHPIRVYRPNLDRNLIGKQNKNCTIIYQ